MNIFISEMDDIQPAQLDLAGFVTDHQLALEIIEDSGFVGIEYV